MSAVWKHGNVRCADAVHARRFDEELVILDLAKGEYYALDPLGALLWSGLQEGTSIEEIAGRVVAEYEVSLEQAILDLTALGEDLLTRGLLVAEPRATTSP